MQQGKNKQTLFIINSLNLIKVLILMIFLLFSQSLFAVWSVDGGNWTKVSAPTKEELCFHVLRDFMETAYDSWTTCPLGGPTVTATGITYPKYDAPTGYAKAICHYSLKSKDESDGRCSVTGLLKDTSIIASVNCPLGYQINSQYDCIRLANEKAHGQSPAETCEGNPCDASTGYKFQTEMDYPSNTLSFVRYYNSFNETQSVLGKQWTHHYLASLTIADTIKVNRPDGKVLEFSNNAGTWISDADITETLTPTGLLWEYKTNTDSIETYNASGQLLSVKTRDGQTTQYAYNIDNLLEQVTGPYGRTLGFAYDTSGRLITLTTPENTQIQYAYDDVTNNLVSVTYPDNTSKTYHYENTSFPSHLTGITDENGIRYATWAYNNAGLAILSEHANSAEKVELVYNTDETTTVTDALGRIKTYTFETHYGLRKPKTIEYSYNDGKQTVTKSKTYTYYPENGRVKEVTDYNGNITYFEYNTRGLITLETQAKGTPEQYTITTTWHPDYRLPTKTVYPDRAINYQYDTQGQLISRTQTTLTN